MPVSELTADAICYCVGVGEDVSFDLALIEKVGCDVFAFDPTPRSIAYVRDFVHEPRFRFQPVGVWSSDCRMKFYAPADSSHVSHSVVNLQGTSTYFEAECSSLETLMKRHGHQQIDLLKLDIEGAEYEVLHALLDGKVRPRVVCVEFDQPSPIHRIIEMVCALRAESYQVIAVDGWNVTCLRVAD